MNALLTLIAVIGFLTLGVWYLAATPPAALARQLRYVVPALVGLVGVGSMLTGRVALGLPVLVFAATLLGQAMRSGRVSRQAPLRSTVRSAMLEMMLDHDTGDMDGLVLGGTHEGRQLSTMSEDDLFDLAREVADDRESVELLEAYLDRRMPGWRDGAQADAGPREAAARHAGAMTEQEAHQILGLEPGATIVEIRKAHRKLMQRVHPDVGGSAFLAQRINEAKDFLLRIHGDRP